MKILYDIDAVATRLKVQAAALTDEDDLREAMQKAVADLEDIYERVAEQWSTLQKAVAFMRDGRAP